MANVMNKSVNLISRTYSNFRGVDFKNRNPDIRRSPDALNVWKNYKDSNTCITTRPKLVINTDIGTSTDGSRAIYDIIDVLYTQPNSTTKVRKIIYQQGDTYFPYSSTNMSSFFSYGDYMKAGYTSHFTFNETDYVVNGKGYYAVKSITQEDVDHRIQPCFS